MEGPSPACLSWTWVQSRLGTIRSCRWVQLYSRWEGRTAPLCRCHRLRGSLLPPLWTHTSEPHAGRRLHPGAITSIICVAHQHAPRRPSQLDADEKVQLSFSDPGVEQPHTLRSVCHLYMNSCTPQDKSSTHSFPPPTVKQQSPAWFIRPLSFSHACLGGALHQDSNHKVAMERAPLTHPVSPPQARPHVEAPGLLLRVKSLLSHLTEKL